MKPTGRAAPAAFSVEPRDTSKAWCPIETSDAIEEATAERLAERAVTIDGHALAPVFVFGAATVVVALVAPYPRLSRLAGTVVAAGAAGVLIPVATLAASGERRSLYGGRFVIDATALAVDAIVAVGVYAIAVARLRHGAAATPATAGAVADDITIDASVPVAWPLLLAAIGLGAVFAASARDVVWLVLAVETVAVAATFLVATEQPRFSIDRLMRAHVGGVIAFAVEAYGVSLVWLGAASTRFSVIGSRLDDRAGLATIGLVVIGAGMVARAGTVAVAAARHTASGP